MVEKIEGIRGAAIVIAVCLIAMGIVMMYKPHTELIWYLGFAFIIIAVNIFIDLILLKLLEGNYGRFRREN